MAAEQEIGNRQNPNAARIEGRRANLVAVVEEQHRAIGNLAGIAGHRRNDVHGLPENRCRDRRYHDGTRRCFRHGHSERSGHIIGEVTRSILRNDVVFTDRQIVRGKRRIAVRVEDVAAESDVAFVEGEQSRGDRRATGGRVSLCRERDRLAEFRRRTVCVQRDFPANARVVPERNVLVCEHATGTRNEIDGAVVVEVSRNDAIDRSRDGRVRVAERPHELRSRRRGRSEENGNFIVGEPAHRGRDIVETVEVEVPGCDILDLGIRSLRVRFGHERTARSIVQKE